MTREQYEKLTLEELDEAVHEGKADEAAAINNTRMEAQVDYLMSREERPMRHEPTPWTIQERKDELGILPNGNSLEIVHNVEGGGGQQIVVGKHTGIDCLTKVNANFIVTACNNHEELLTSLGWIVEFCQEHSEWFAGEDGAEGEWLETAIKLIAKAKWREQ